VEFVFPQNLANVGQFSHDKSLAEVEIIFFRLKFCENFASINYRKWLDLCTRFWVLWGLGPPHHLVVLYLIFVFHVMVLAIGFYWGFFGQFLNAMGLF